MSGSALVGQPPANQDDFYIVRGLLFQSGLLNKFDPKQGLPTKPPPVVRHDTRGPSITVGLSVAIALTVVITATRVIAKYVMRFSSLGWDDFLIVIATVSHQFSSY